MVPVSADPFEMDTSANDLNGAEESSDVDVGGGTGMDLVSEEIDSARVREEEEKSEFSGRDSDSGPSSKPSTLVLELIPSSPSSPSSMPEASLKRPREGDSVDGEAPSKRIRIQDNEEMEVIV